MTLNNTYKLCTYFGMKLKIQPFWDATLCHWMSSSDILMYHIAFIFSSQQQKNISRRLLESKDESTVTP
jgi:hypothetical protein